MPVVIYLVQDRSHCGGLSATSLTCYKNYSLVPCGKLIYYRRQSQAGKLGNMVVQNTDCCRNAGLLAEKVDSHPPSGQCAAQVQLTYGAD